MSNATKKTASVKNEDLRVGDVIRVLGGWKQILSFKPYEGPLSDILFSIVQYESHGKIVGMSLEIGGYSEVMQ